MIMEAVFWKILELNFKIAINHLGFIYFNILENKRKFKEMNYRVAE